MRIFISYSSRDRPAALQLLKLVEDAGHDAWMDLFDIQPAQRLGQELEAGVRRADVFCILLSPAAVASKWVMQEIDHARQIESGGVRILPLILKPCVIPEGLADHVGIDATRGVDEPSVSHLANRGGTTPQGPHRREDFQFTPPRWAVASPQAEMTLSNATYEESPGAAQHRRQFNRPGWHRSGSPIGRCARQRSPRSARPLSTPAHGSRSAGR